tara:strand:- start:721 stop:2115 length:1395 start_codon:yes stop_codon:yes gene_type:complete
MSTLIQLRRASLTDIGDTNLTATVFAQGEPLAVYAGANTTPRLYIGDGSTDIDADLIGLGGPNSVTVDQIRGLGSTTPASNKFANTGSGTRVITIDSNGTAALAALDTSAITGTTLTMGGYDTSVTNVDGIKLDATTDAKISIQRNTADTVTDDTIEVLKGNTATFKVNVQGDIETCRDVTATGDIKADQMGAGSTADFASGTNIKGHFSTADSSFTPNSSADELFVENSGDAGITIGSGTTNTGNIYFGKSGDDDIGGFIFQHHGTAASSSLQTRVAGATRATLTGAGNLTVTGKVTAEGFDAGSNQIDNVTDPTADQDAATKKYVDRGVSGLLEEISPNFVCGSGSVSLSGSYNKLSSYRLGQMVTITGHIKVSSGGPSGVVKIDNLIYTCKTGNEFTASAPVTCLTNATLIRNPYIKIKPNTKELHFGTTGNNGVNFTDANGLLRNSDEFYIHITYITSDA